MQTAAGTATIVFADSPDVAGSIGREGYIARRFAASSQDGTAVSTRTVATARLDVLAQQLSGAESGAIGAPGRIDEWLRCSVGPPALPDDTVAYVSSMADAVSAEVARLHADGRLLQLPAGELRHDEAGWLDTHAAPAAPDPQGLAGAIGTVSRALAERGIAWMIFNVSTYDPTVRVHWHRDGEAEPHAVMANRMNLLLDPLPKDGIAAVVDVDRIVAEIGAGAAVLAPGRYSDEAHALIAEEAAATLADIPAISERFGTDTMRLEVPRYDRRTGEGLIATWHVTPPAPLSPGDVLFDVRFENLRVRPGATAERESHRALQMSVVATRTGYLREITMPAGARVAAGTTVGVVTRQPDTATGDVTDAAHFPVGVKVRSR